MGKYGTPTDYTSNATVLNRISVSTQAKPAYAGVIAYSSLATTEASVGAFCVAYSATAGNCGIYTYDGTTWNKETTPSTDKLTIAWPDICKQEVDGYNHVADYIGSGVNFAEVLAVTTAFINELFAQEITVGAGGFLSANSDKVRLSSTGIESRSRAFTSTPQDGDRRMLIEDDKVLIQLNDGGGESNWSLSKAASFEMNDIENVFVGGTGHFLGFVTGSDYAYFSSAITSVQGDGIDLGTAADPWAKIYGTHVDSTAVHAASDTLPSSPVAGQVHFFLDSSTGAMTISVYIDGSWHSKTI